MKVVVFGYYNHQNIGDDLFRDAFIAAFPDFDFSFCSSFEIEDVKDASAIFIGGGSFLSSDPFISKECLDIIREKPIFYIGVGAETSIHVVHRELIKLAKLAAIRSNVGLDKIQKLNKNVIVMNDLVYSLFSNKKQKEKQNKSILILPNIFVVPQNHSEHWRHNSWLHFKFEFSQFLDFIVEDGYKIDFFPMCLNESQNDIWAASEIIASMKNRGSYIVENNFDIVDFFSKYDLVITQRFHGIILSEIARVPYISIHHHDKLKQSLLNEGSFISYYASDKKTFIDNFYIMINKRLENISIESDIFDEVKNQVNLILRESK